VTTTKYEEGQPTMSSVLETSENAIRSPAAGNPPWKSALDIILSLALLLVTWPVILAALLVVRLTSRGWPLYTQTRLGLGGRHYKMYKIRSMYQDCERHTGPRWSTPKDPRVTPVGRFLRVTHIDELPQLVNILRGDMSLVGPRPERPELAAGLERALPCYRERLSVRPGVTGLAQVQLPPDVDLESVRRKLACDLYYINRVSPWLDLRIMMGTALGILGTPVRVTLAILRIPGGDVVDTAYRDQSGEMDTIPLGVETLTQANPA
jgi:lipopolysaccharide/colanic/teichoic acid biosynthesis glycosyltransferase